MLVPLSWLHDFAPIDLAPEALSDVFNNLGLVVEGVEKTGQTYDGIVTARVLATRPHPNADKVHLVDVDTGDGQPLQIVCGAFNMKAGDVVPLASLGTVMPNGMAIERRKMRGEWSNGMLCSAHELELSDDHAGIMILPGDTPVGVPLREALAVRPDAVFDLAIEANRPDALCMTGVARDVAAKLGRPFRLPEVRPRVVDRPASWPQPRAWVDAPDLCPRFVAAVVRNVRVQPSPEWVANRLTLAGMRPINNVVDASNYVMLELGAPTHPYDLDRVPGGRLGVRWAHPGEQLETLDGVVRTLGADGAHDGVITDGDGHPIGIAGVMGGASTEIADSTTAVLFEAAWWTPMAIARTAKRLGLRTEASARFERGTDIEGIPAAVARFVDILALTCPDAAVESYDDVRPVPAAPPWVVRLRTARVNKILGTSLDAVTVRRHLEPMGFACATVPGHDGVLDVTVPTYRPDCEREIDLVEEVGRQYGLANIPSTTPANTPVGRLSPYMQQRRAVRAVLTGRGCAEAWTSSLLAPGDLERSGLAGGPEAAVRLANPMAPQESVLRTSLLPGLLRALAHNTSHRNPAIRLFEIGHVFGPPRPGQDVPDEREHLAVVLAADGPPGGPADDAGAAKRLLDALIEAVGLASGAVTVAAAEPPGLHPTRSARVVGAGTGLPFGSVGEVDPGVLAEWGIERRVGWLQVDLQTFLGLPRRSAEMQRFRRFPSSDIDLAFVAPDTTPALDVEQALRRAGGALLESLSLFDVYRGPSLGEGRRSLAYRLRFVAPDRTLTDAEVADARQRCIDAVTARTGAALRG